MIIPVKVFPEKQVGFADFAVLKDQHPRIDAGNCRGRGCEVQWDASAAANFAGRGGLVSESAVGGGGAVLQDWWCTGSNPTVCPVQTRTRARTHNLACMRPTPKPNKPPGGYSSWRYAPVPPLWDLPHSLSKCSFLASMDPRCAIQQSSTPK